MPNPTPSDLHVDGYLTDVSVGYVQSSTKFGADRVFPRVPVQKQSDKVALYDRGDFNRDSSGSRRGPGDEAIQVGYRVGSTTYTADEWALEHQIDDQVRANADSPYMPERDATLFLTSLMAIRREREFVTNFFSSGNIWTGSSDGADLVGGTDFTRWSNAASTPLEDVDSAGNTIESVTGFRPNKLAINRTVWGDLKNHPDIVDRIKHTAREPVTTDLVARLMGIDEIVVLAAMRATHGEGTSTAAGSYIAGDKGLLVYAPSSPGLMTPSGGYTFVWSGLIGSNEGQRIERYRREEKVSDAVRIRAAWAQKRIAPDLGVIFNDASTR